MGLWKTGISSHFAPFFSYSRSCSYILHLDVMIYLDMIPRFPPFPPLSPTSPPPFPTISPHFPPCPPFFQTPKSWFGELVSSVAVSAYALRRNAGRTSVLLLCSVLQNSNIPRYFSYALLSIEGPIEKPDKLLAPICIPDSALSPEIRGPLRLHSGFKLRHFCTLASWYEAAYTRSGDKEDNMSVTGRSARAGANAGQAMGSADMRADEFAPQEILGQLTDQQKMVLLGQLMQEMAPRISVVCSPSS